MFEAKEWRMKIQIEQNKSHKKWTSIAQEFIVSFTIIISCVTIVYIGNNSNAWGINSNSNSRSPIQYRSPNRQLPDDQ